MKILNFIFKARKIEKTGDDTAVASLLEFVWRMTRWHQVWACLLAVVVALLNLAPIELQRRIVNEVVETQDVPLLLQFGMLYLGIIVLHQAVKFGLNSYQVWMTESTNLYTRRHLLGLYGKSVDEVGEASSGRVVSIVGAEVDKLGGFVGEGLSQSCANVSLLLGVLAYMVVVEPGIALFAIAFMIPQIVVTPFMQRYLNKLVERHVGYMRTLGDEVSELDAPTDSGDLAILKKIFSNRLRFNMLKFLLKAVLNLLNSLGPLAVLLYGGYLVMMGETQVGVIVAFISGFDRISGPVRELVGFYRVYAQANVQHQMIAKWMAEVTK
ncbi:MAG: ABC transporter transmembrane domain-containing protein [Sulfitobacter sp.]